MSVRVATDFRCAACWLAVEPTRALESKLGRSFTWLPFPAVASTRPRIDVSRADRSARHFELRSEYLANDLRRYAASRGLEVGETFRAIDVTAASLGLLWIGRKAPALAGEYVARLFEDIWSRGIEPDLALVGRRLGPASSGFHAFAGGPGPHELAATRDELAAAGLWDVPGWLTGGEVFLGRQHLPMVEWFATAEEEAAAAIRRR